MMMNAFLLALREIRNNLMRAGLTTLGIVIGVASVIAMVTLGSGASQSVTAGIASMGRNLLMLTPGQMRRGPPQAATPFDANDVSAIDRDVTGLAAVAPNVSRSVVAVLGNHNKTTQLAGSNNDYFKARDWALSSGRLFTDGELRSGKAVCIVGETVRKELFGEGDPVGARIRVDKVTCEIIGLLISKGQSSFGPDQDDVIIMPLKTVQRRFAGNDQISSIWISVGDAAAVPRAKRDLEALMRERRRIPEGAANDFTVNDQQELTRVVESTTAILTAFLSAVAAVSLLVGGIGIMNIMLVSVTERTREIGIRLAIGARANDVLLQFLIEAVVMSALGGIVGVIIGLTGSGIATIFLELPFIFSPGVIIIAVAFAAGVGVAFGYFPARRAARLDPIEALRHE
jgi:putative ABC transport system permease protein